MNSTYYRCSYADEIELAIAMHSCQLYLADEKGLAKFIFSRSMTLIDEIELANNTKDEIDLATFEIELEKL